MSRPNPSLRQWAKKLDAARDAADNQRFNIGHAAALTGMVGDALSESRYGPDDDAQTMGLLVEYIARQIKQHADDLADELQKIERLAMAMQRGQAPEDDSEPEGATWSASRPPQTMRRDASP
jgi:hypothetical protein